MDGYFSMYMCWPFSYLAGRMTEFGNSIYRMCFGEILDDKVCITGRHQESCHPYFKNTNVWSYSSVLFRMGFTHTQVLGLTLSLLPSDLCVDFLAWNYCFAGFSNWATFRNSVRASDAGAEAYADVVCGRLHRRLSIIQRLFDFAFLDFHSSS